MSVKTSRKKVKFFQSNYVVRKLLRIPDRAIRSLHFRFGRLHDGSPIRESPVIVFIGFNRTATKAFHKFFISHGYPSVHKDGNRLAMRMLRNLEKQKRIFRGYDCEYKIYSDLILATESQIVECNQFFREMHRDYPNAMFILNTRPTIAWIKSRMTFRGGDFLRRQMEILGTDNLSDVEALWMEQKLSHELQVRRYFAHYPNQFLEIDVSTDDVPAKLSRFLHKKFETTFWHHEDFK